jgi:hypothetical protein
MHVEDPKLVGVRLTAAAQLPGSAANDELIRDIIVLKSSSEHSVVHRVDITSTQRCSASFSIRRTVVFIVIGQKYSKPSADSECLRLQHGQHHGKMGQLQHLFSLNGTWRD